MRKLSHLILFCIPVAVIALLLSSSESLAYSKVGVIDCSGKLVIPCNYRTAKYLGHGVYYLENLDSKHPLKWSYDGELFNKNGKQIAVKLPTNCSLSGVYFPDCKKDENFEEKLPEGTILEIHSPEGKGLCDLAGKILLAPKFHIFKPYKGYFPISERENWYDKKLLFILSSRDGQVLSVPENSRGVDGTGSEIRPYKIVKDGRRLYGYMSYRGEIVLPAKYRSAVYYPSNGLFKVTPVSKEDSIFIDREGRKVSSVDVETPINRGGVQEHSELRNFNIVRGFSNENFFKVRAKNANLQSKGIIVSILSSDRLALYKQVNNFNSICWKTPNPNGFPWGASRLPHFFRFLNQYNLIGMSRRRVEELLGKSETGTLGYHISAIGCGKGTNLYMLLEDNRVTGWKLVLTGDGVTPYIPKEGGWVTINLEVDSEYFSKTQSWMSWSEHLIPKKTKQ